MRVTCTFYGPFRESLDEASLSVELPPDSTVGDVLAALAESHPELGESAFPGGEPGDSTHVTWNRTHIKHLKGLDTPVEDGDELRIFPPVTGG